MKELKLQFILLSAQQAELHYYWFGTDYDVLINCEIKTPEKKISIQYKYSGGKKEQLAEHNFLILLMQ